MKSDYEAELVSDCCKAHERAEELATALRACLATIYRLRGLAFVGSRTPRDREPELLSAIDACKAAEAALAKDLGEAR